MSRARSGHWRVTALLSFVLATAIAVVYWPALGHLPHSDQSNFVLDTIDCDGFLSVIAHTYSFARTRVLCGGDTQLFRPVLFIWLSALQEFLDLRFEWCQALSIVLHIVVAVLFFTLLERVFRRDHATEPANIWTRACSPFTYLPFAFALFFALNYAIIEQVIWYHIQGYLLALVLILGAVHVLVSATDRMRAGASAGMLVALAWALTLVAAFTYELGQFFAVCAGLYLFGARGAAWRPRLQAGLAFLAIVAIYQGANQVDRRQHAGSYQDDAPLAALAENACNVATLENFTRYALYTTVQPFLPGHLFAHSHGKVGADEMIWPSPPDEPPFTVLAHSFGGFQIEPHGWDNHLQVRPSLFLGSAVILLLIGLTLAGAWRMPERSLALAGLLLATGLAQACMIVLGRLNMRPGPSTLAYNSHYTYMGLLFSLSVAGIGLAHVTARSRLGRGLAYGSAGLLVLGLLALSAGSACKVHEFNAELTETFRPSWRWVCSLRRFVQAHRHEPDFRFAVAWERTMPNYCQIPVPYLFYRRYIDHDHPKYVLSYEDEKFVGVPFADWQARHPVDGPRLCPEFVRLGRFYRVFYHDERYYAVASWRVSGFLACPDPESVPDLERDRDLPTLLEWIDANTP